MLAQLIADNVSFVAAAWMGLALLASLISIRPGVSVALVEIGMGVLGGNSLGFQTTPSIDFLATFGSGLLTFLAGAELEPESLRRHLRPTLVIGSVPFGAPFVGAWLFAQYIAAWLWLWPSARAFRFTPSESSYTTLLMSTGLTFGTISALFGLCIPTRAMVRSPAGVD